MPHGLIIYVYFAVMRIECYAEPDEKGKKSRFYRTASILLVFVTVKGNKYPNKSITSPSPFENFFYSRFPFDMCVNWRHVFCPP
jgi:hypothetical protein